MPVFVMKGGGQNILPPVDQHGRINYWASLCCWVSPEHGFWVTQCQPGPTYFLKAGVMQLLSCGAEPKPVMPAKRPDVPAQAQGLISRTEMFTYCCTHIIWVQAALIHHMTWRLLLVHFQPAFAMDSADAVPTLSEVPPVCRSEHIQWAAASSSSTEAAFGVTKQNQNQSY